MQKKVDNELPSTSSHSFTMSAEHKAHFIVHFETLGCKLNQIESESACKFFSDFLWRVSVKPLISNNDILDDEIADTKICIVNTCTVTAKAEQKCRRTINLLLKTYSSAVIIVTGCYAQVESDFFAKMNERIVVLPGTKKDFLADLPKEIENAHYDFADSAEKNAVFIRKLISALENAEAQNDTTQTGTAQNTNKTLKETHFRLSTDTFFNHSRSSVKIQDGCNNSCSFCRIHIARGFSVSLDAKTVLERIRLLEKTGQSEVVLTGVNLSQYRSAIPQKNAPDKKNGDFADLLEYLNDNTSSIYFRISSLYPEFVNEKLCSILKNSRVRPHFHFSVQSGSDKILEKMNRPYKAVDVLRAVNSVRNIFGNPFIACDIIAGFPGETESDFEATMKLCTECNFAWIHAFPFSPRPGTEAFSMKNQIPQDVTHKRIKSLEKLADNNKKNYILSFVGKTVKAIVEKRQDKLVRCVTENFLHAHLVLDKNINPLDFAGKQIDVTILGRSDLPECECECIL